MASWGPEAYCRNHEGVGQAPGYNFVQGRRNPSGAGEHSWLMLVLVYLQPLRDPTGSWAVIPSDLLQGCTC